MLCNGVGKRMKEEIKYERTLKDKKTLTHKKFQIVAKKGSRNYPFDPTGKDRLFFLRLTDMLKEIHIEFPYSHSDQIELLRLVINNVLLPHIKKRDIYRFRKILDELEEKEK